MALQLSSEGILVSGSVKAAHSYSVGADALLEGLGYYKDDFSTQCTLISIRFIFA